MAHNTWFLSSFPFFPTHISHFRQLLAPITSYHHEIIRISQSFRPPLRKPSGMAPWRCPGCARVPPFWSTAAPAAAGDPPPPAAAGRFWRSGASASWGRLTAARRSPPHASGITIMRTRWVICVFVPTCCLFEYVDWGIHWFAWRVLGGHLGYGVGQKKHSSGRSLLGSWYMGIQVDGCSLLKRDSGVLLGDVKTTWW